MYPYVKTSYVGLCGKEKKRTFVFEIKFCQISSAINFVQISCKNGHSARQ
jgi:hypothetical protein